MTMALFPIHLCLYVKYSRRLYMLLKRRRLDAWFEDPDSYMILISDIIFHLFGVCMFVFVFALHFYILYKAFKRLWKRRIAYKNCTREMYRPLLVGN